MERMLEQVTLGVRRVEALAPHPQQQQLLVLLHAHPLLPPDPFKPSFLMLAQGASDGAKRQIVTNA
jgi:hypothetical protein